MSFPTVQQFYEGMKDKLKLVLLNSSIPLTRKIHSSESHRPGLAFSGFFDYFAFDRIQVLGKTEIRFLDKLKGGTRKRNLSRFFSYRIPCIVCAKNQHLPKDFLDMATGAEIPVFRAVFRTSICVSQITVFIENAMAPESLIHGTLLDVYGIGTLLLGQSGIGKSECALELIERGHRLIADDVVKMKREGDTVVGCSNDIVQHRMEIRGLGIIDIDAIFGVGAVRHRKRIGLVVTLERRNPKQEYDRLGIESKKYDLLDVLLPHLVIPVRPGRNIPILVEVAALTQRAKFMGHDFPRDFNASLIDRMKAESETLHTKRNASKMADSNQGESL